MRFFRRRERSLTHVYYSAISTRLLERRGEVLGPVGAVGAALLIEVGEADIAQPTVEQVAAVTVVRRGLVEEGVDNGFGRRVASGDILRGHGELVARGVDTIPWGLARGAVVVEI